ncbi:MAG: hypothetical protein J2P49_04875 [Methylocapsa sp.]|nr:hypothetical protein [Methylocapsa sp.]
MFNVSASCVIKLTQRAAAAGSRESRKFGGRKRYCLGRHEDALWDTIGFALDDFSAKECFNYFRNAGYGSV